MGCGSCTACCTMLPIEAINKPVNTPCQYCDGGCSIYKEKPQTCTEFECAYLHGKGVPESLRPDKCGVIFIKESESKFKGIIVTNVPVSNTALGQIKSFEQQGCEVNFGYV